MSRHGIPYNSWLVTSIVRMPRFRRRASGLVTAALVAGLEASVHGQGERGVDVPLSDGARRYLVGQWANGRLTLAAPCIPGPTPSAGLTLPAAPGVDTVQPRQVRTGSDEWNRVSPALLALAARREQEQRLAPGASARGTRFLDWLFAATVDGQVTYYFETSRRVPSPPTSTDDTDADPPSTLRVDVSGFARVEADAVPLGTKAELRWEEDGRPRGSQRPELRPLAILRAAEPVWILEDATPTRLVIMAVTIGARRTHQSGATRIGRC